MRIGICDNDKTYLQWLIGLLRQIREVSESVIVSYQEAGWLLDDIESHREHFDILIINRELKRTSTIDILLRIADADPICRIIILNDDNSIDEDLYQLSKGILLPKEHVPLHLVTVIQRSISSLLKESDTLLSVICKREHIFLPCSQVLYMEKLLRKTIVVTEHQLIETYQSPRELIQQALPSVFSQCHRSYYINMHKIYSVTNSHVKLYNSTVLPIGNTFSDTFQQEFKDFCSRTTYKIT